MPVKTPDGPSASIWACWYLDPSFSIERAQAGSVPILTIGFPVHLDELELVLAGESHADGDFRDFTTIPVGTIRELTKIATVKAPEWVLDWRRRYKHGH